jgi:hypothetical protein
MTQHADSTNHETPRNTWRTPRPSVSPVLSVSPFEHADVALELAVKPALPRAAAGAVLYMCGSTFLGGMLFGTVLGAMTGEQLQGMAPKEITPAAAAGIGGVVGLVVGMTPVGRVLVSLAGMTLMAVSAMEVGATLTSVPLERALARAE